MPSIEYSELYRSVGKGGKDEKAIQQDAHRDIRTLKKLPVEECIYFGTNCIAR
jgi:hypothetical protein